MRRLLTPILIFALAALAMAGEKKPTLNDEMDRINYVIGHQIGSDFRKQEIDLDRMALNSGLEDGHADNQPRLEAEEMNRLLVNLKKEITQDMELEAVARMRKRQSEIKHKRQLGQEFLRANENKSGIVSTGSGLQYRILSKGQGNSPKENERVKIDYTARRLSGQVFDSSEKHGGPTVYPVSGLIPGFSEALRMMKPGDKWELFLSPELAYGRRGPLGYEVVIIEVELLEVLPAEAGTVGTAEPSSATE